MFIQASFVFRSAALLALVLSLLTELDMHKAACAVQSCPYQKHGCIFKGAAKELLEHHALPATQVTHHGLLEKKLETQQGEITLLTNNYYTLNTNLNIVLHYYRDCRSALETVSGELSTQRSEVASVVQLERQRQVLFARMLEQHPSCQTFARKHPTLTTVCVAALTCGVIVETIR